MRIAIVGAGMAGLACAESLRAGGHDVTLFDKGARPGGRMSTRTIATRLGEASFDHGAQYFTARDPGFADRIERWRSDGIVAKWVAAGADAWVGVPGMSAPIAAMALTFDVRWSARIEKLVRVSDGWQVRGAQNEAAFDTVLVAVPAEQVSDLIAPFDARMAAAAAAAPSQPCWTLMAAFPCALPISVDTMKDLGAIGWAARNSAKPGRGGPEAWLIQATPGWSSNHIEDDGADVTRMLLHAFSVAAGVSLPTPMVTDTHRWRYAKSGAWGAQSIWNCESGLGLCGDWLIGPRVECAWLSGTALAFAINQTA